MFGRYPWDLSVSELNEALDEPLFTKRAGAFSVLIGTLVFVGSLWWSHQPLPYSAALALLLGAGPRMLLQAIRRDHLVLVLYSRQREFHGADNSAQDLIRLLTGFPDTKGTLVLLLFFSPALGLVSFWLGWEMGVLGLMIFALGGIVFVLGWISPWHRVRTYLTVAAWTDATMRRRLLAKALAVDPGLR